MKSHSVAFLLAFAFCACAHGGEFFTVPADGTAAVWQAEAARASGGWKKVSDETASGGAYASNTAGEGLNVLEFRFKTDRPVSLRVVPVWWRNSEEKTALRFPNSLPYFKRRYVWPAGFPDRTKLSRKPLFVKERPGPDKLAVLDGRLYFSAPTSGALGIVDAASEKVVGRVELGGYIADILADAEGKRIFAADAANDRVIVYDVGAGRVTKKIPVPRMPFALELAGERVLVACMEGRKLVVISRTRLAIEKEKALTFKPKGIAMVDGTAVLWPLAVGFDPETGKAAPLDRMAWPEHTTLIWTDPPHILPMPITGKRGGFQNQYFRRYDIRFVSPGKLRFSCREFLAHPKQPSSKKRIEATVKIPELGSGAEPNISALINCGKNLYFLVPGQKSLYRVDLSNPAAPEKIPMGDPVSFTVFAGRSDGRYYEFCLGTGLKVKQHRPGTHRTIKPVVRDTFVFVADRAGKQLHVVEAAAGSVIGRIPVRGEPTSVFVSSRYVYAACTNPDEIVKIDVGTHKVAKRFPLPSAPRAVQVFRLADAPATWLPLPPLSEWPKRVVAHLAPVGYDPGTLEPKAAPHVPFLPASRCKAQATVGSRKKEFWCDDMHVIRVDDKSWIDTSAVTDRVRSTELGAADVAGTITLSVDDGPRHDWMRNRFMTPRRHHLVRGTEEFDVYNAPVLSVGAGEHALKVHSNSPWARLDALKVQPVLDGRLSMELHPEPRAVHSKVPLPSYRGVFAHDEPVKFSADIVRTAGAAERLTLSWTVTDFIGRKVAEGAKDVTATAGGGTVVMDIPLNQTGVFTLRAACADASGTSLVRYTRFTRLPKLEHPSLLYAKRDEGAIRARISKYPRLFERYRLWLRRNLEKPGFLPRRMGGGVSQSYVQMEARWRALGCALSVLFLEKDEAQKKLFVKKIAPLMAAGHQEGYEHAWEFAGADAVMFDLLAARYSEIAAYRDRLSLAWRDSAHIADTLMAADEPLSGIERAFLDYQLRAFHNIVDYFSVHAGERGGNWWQGTRTNCGCSLQGVFRALLYFQGFLGYDRMKFFAAPFFRNAFIHAQYATPHYDKRRLIRRALALRSPGHHGTGGKITAMFASLVTRNPVERKMYDADEWIRKMNGPLPGDETAQVDRLMAETNRFVIPIFLAVGIYEPDSAKLDFEDIPPSMLFDVEGEACMKSDWSPEMTDVYFVSGARDVSYRVEPNHLRIVKGGQVLLGTKALQGDHGDPVPSWGNVVLMGSTPPTRWLYAADWPRMNERAIMNRFPAQVINYNLRAYSLAGIRPMNFPWRVYDGIILHSHTEHKFHRPGRIIAYETWPEFDYVAGDATAAWPLGQAEEDFRQVVFVRPDVVVVYDRVKLGARQDKTTWMAATASLTVQGKRFTIRAGKRALHGLVLAPGKAKLVASGNTLTFTAPTSSDKRAEYLVVFQTSMDRGKPVNAALVKTPGEIGAVVNYDGGKIKVLFNRTGAVGGKISVGAVKNQPFIRRIDHSYRRWKNHYLFKKWMQDPRLRQYIIDEDFRKFSKAELPDIKAPPKKVYQKAVTGIHNGTLHCDGATAFTIAGARCPNFNFGAKDFLVQVRFAFNKDAPLTSDLHNYGILMKGAYGSPLLQIAVRGGSYRGVFARCRSRGGMPYLDVLPRKDMTKVFLDGRFHTLAFARKGKTAMLYVDGKKVGERANYDTVVRNPQPFEIGKLTQGGYFEGEIDDVRLWRFDSGLPAGFEKAIAAYEKTRDQVPAELKNAPGVKYSIYTFNDKNGSRFAADKGNNGYDLSLSEL